MDDKARHIAVGITAIVGLGGVIALMMLFGYLPQWMEGGYEVKVELANASGLVQSSRVKLSGIDIGRVTSVQLEEPPRQGTVVTLLVREEVNVPKNARVRAQSPLLGGSPTLAFETVKLKPGEQVQWLATDGTAKVKGEALTMVSQFAGELQAALSEPTRIMGELVEQVERVSNEWVRVGSNMNELLGKRTAEAVDAGEVIGNLSTVLARADQRLAELQPVIAGLNLWINDSKLLDDLFSTTAAARDVAAKLAVAADRATTLIGNADGRLDELATRLVAVADDLSAVVGAAGSAVQKIDTGTGTIGKMVNDPSLYENLNDCAVRLQSLLDEASLLIQKWKAEGLPVQF